MDLCTRLVVVEACVLVGGFYAVVLYKLVTGEISLAGLLDSKEPGGRSVFSPARLQLLIFTVVVAAKYLHDVVVDPRRDALPSLPMSVIVALGGSQVVYLGGKAMSAYIQPLLKKQR